MLSLQQPDVGKPVVAAGDGLAAPAPGAQPLSRALEALRMKEVYIPCLGLVY